MSNANLMSIMMVACTSPRILSGLAGRIGGTIIHIVLTGGAYTQHVAQRKCLFSIPSADAIMVNNDAFYHNVMRLELNSRSGKSE